MQLSVFLSLALAVRISHSSPIIKSPSRVAARQAPEPSTYPLGEACGHEWKYLNFNPEDATDQGRLQKLHDVICSGEMRAVSAWGREAALNNAAPYARYFPPSDEEDDTQAQTAEILLLIAGTSTADDGAVGALVETFVIDNLDFGDGHENVPTCADGRTLAYTLEDPSEGGDNLEKIHFCDIAYDRPTLVASIDCATLDPYPSTKLDSLTRIALHEMMHYSSVGPASSLGLEIVDVFNADGEPAYEPSRAHGLIDENQDNQPGFPEINADSYAWMSIDAFMSQNCIEDINNWPAFFTENPPPYS